MDIKHTLGDNSVIFRDATYIRRTVFVREQNMPEIQEIDAHEDHTVHYVGYIEQDPAVTARVHVLKDGGFRIQRVATIKSFRGQGLGFKLIEAIIEDAKRTKTPYIILFAQDHAIGFYEKLGFEVISEGEMEANIPHHYMKLTINH